jgi:Exostosin family
MTWISRYDAGAGRGGGKGDGWSPRAEDAILHGCIPMVVMDHVDPVFATILDWSEFSIRVREVC